MSQYINLNSSNPAAMSGWDLYTAQGNSAFPPFLTVRHDDDTTALKTDIYFQMEE